MIKDVVSAFENPNHSSFTRILSLSLRHGAPIHYIVEQLQKGDKDMDLFSFSKVIGRVLKKYIQDGTRPGGSNDCPECKAPDSLQYTEGCVICTSCGHGKC
jgi:ribonucleoside-diphosphate reductase alpha chain